MLILASASPRRAQLLQKITFDFRVQKSNYNEEFKDLPPHEFAMDCALNKAKSVESSKGDTVLAADTIVVLGKKILGKPANSAEAFKMLKSLSGKTHSVITGICLKNSDKTICLFCKSTVAFKKMKKEDIEEYIKGGSPLDKAGAYGIQDDYIKGVIKNTNGSIDNIIGLPTELLATLLKEEKCR